jgi:hypothetical protein
MVTNFQSTTLQRCHDDVFRKEQEQMMMERSLVGAESDVVARQFTQRRNYFRYDIVLQQVTSRVKLSMGKQREKLLTCTQLPAVGGRVLNPAGHADT